MRVLVRTGLDVLATAAAICLAAAANVDTPANLQEGPGRGATAREEPALVVGVDVPALARAVYGESAAEIGDFAATEHGVVRRFVLNEDPLEVELIVGIYADVGAATAALWRGVPSVIGMTKREIGDQSLLAGMRLRIQYRNLLLILQVGRHPTEEMLDGLADRVQAVFKNAAIVSYGERVNEPTVRIVAAKGSAQGYCQVILNVEGGGGDCLVYRGRELEAGEFLVATDKWGFDKEFTVRVVRRTGEIVEIPASEFPSEAWESWKEPERSGLTPADRATIVEKLRSGEGNPRERVQMMVRLAQDPGADLADFFREAIETEEDSVIRCHALRGLANAEAADALDTYRRIAGDANAPELLRRDAVLLIMKYGATEDLPLLVRTLAEEPEKDALADALARAIRQLEARKRRAETGQPQADGDRSRDARAADDKAP